MTFTGDFNRNPSMLRFEAPKYDSSIIKVIGVGGGGSNAVNHMFNQGIQGVDFIVCNTDAQALNLSPIPAKIQLGLSLTEGRGAGSLPSVGRNAALENIEDIRKRLEENTKMLFITAGMGGGTGTGAAPVIASVARELNILTVGIVTLPFSFEGTKRRKQAEEGIKELREHVDSLLVISNDKLRELCGDLPLSKAFGKADNILTTAAKGIAEIITVPGYINVDFEDVKTVMKNSGVAIMGSGTAEGEDRALLAVEEALTSPLLNDNNIDGASNILLYISSGALEVTMDEVTVITDYIQSKAGKNAEIIWGNGQDERLENMISITLVATGFEINGTEKITPRAPEVNTILVGTVGDLTTTPPTPVTPENFSAAPQPAEEFVLHTEIPLPEEAPAPVIQMPQEQTDLTEALPEAGIPEISLEPLSEEPAERIVFDLYSPQEETDTPETQDPVNESEPLTFTSEPAEPILPEPELQEIVLPDLSFLHETPPPVQARTPEPVVPDHTAMDRTSDERRAKLRELSIKLKSSDGIDQLEREPAYLRQQVEINEPRHSSESEVSQFTVATDPKGGIELKQNNSYLHDQPD